MAVEISRAESFLSAIKKLSAEICEPGGVVLQAMSGQQASELLDLLRKIAADLAAIRSAAEAATYDPMPVIADGEAVIPPVGCLQPSGRSSGQAPGHDSVGGE